MEVDYVVTVKIHLTSEETTKEAIAKHAIEGMGIYVANNELDEEDMGYITVEVDGNSIERKWEAVYSPRRDEVYVMVDGVQRFSIPTEEVQQAITDGIVMSDDTALTFWILSNYAEFIEALEELA